MSIFESIINLIKSLFSKQETVQPSEQASASKSGYIEGTDMKESVFLAMTGGNQQNADEIKRKLQQGCAKGQYPFTFSVGNWMYTITKIADASLHEQYGLQYKAEQYHD